MPLPLYLPVWTWYILWSFKIHCVGILWIFLLTTVFKILCNKLYLKSNALAKLVNTACQKRLFVSVSRSILVDNYLLYGLIGSRTIRFGEQYMLGSFTECFKTTFLIFAKERFFNQRAPTDAPPKNLTHVGVSNTNFVIPELRLLKPSKCKLPPKRPWSSDFLFEIPAGP